MDGHLRKSLADPEAEVPVLIGDWDEEQERTILATLDPIASMAVGQAEQFDRLRESIDADSRWLRDLLDTIAAGIERTDDTASVPATTRSSPRWNATPSSITITSF